MTNTQRTLSAMIVTAAAGALSLKDDASDPVVTASEPATVQLAPPKEKITPAPYRRPARIEWVAESGWREALKEHGKSLAWISFELESGCPACDVVKARVYTDPKVIWQAGFTFVCVKITDRKRADAWGVRQFPTSVFVDPDGKIIEIYGRSRHATPQSGSKMYELLMAAWRGQISKSLFESEEKHVTPTSVNFCGHCNTGRNVFCEL